MTKCSLCGDGRKNMAWMINGKPVRKRHFDKIKNIGTIFEIEVFASEPTDEVRDEAKND